MEMTQINAQTGTLAPACIRIERADLFPALQLLAKVVERGNTIPILSNILFDATPDGIVTITGTDLDLAVIRQIACEVESPGRFTVACASLLDLLRGMDAQTMVKIAVDGTRAHVSGGRINLALPTLPAADFPIMKMEGLAHRFCVPAEQLARDLEFVRSGISTEESRYYLNGVFMEAASEGLVMSATDGHRLMRVIRPLPEVSCIAPDPRDLQASRFADVIIPRKTIGILGKIIDKAKVGEVAIETSRTKLRFSFGTTAIETKAIDGTFPDYRRCIPSHNDKHMVVMPKDLVAAIKRVTAIASDKTRACAFTLNNGSVDVSCKSPENGTAVEQRPVHFKSDLGDANGMVIGWNARYVQEVLLAGGKAETVTIEMADPAAPSLFRFEGMPHLTAVLMPMRMGAVATHQSVTAGAQRQQSPTDAFRAAFAKAWEARDREGMNAACAAYRETHPADENSARNATRDIMEMAIAIKRLGNLRRAWAGSGGHPVRPRKPSPAGEPLAYLRIAESEALGHLAWLAALPGYHADDPRLFLPVEVRGLRGSAFISSAKVASGGRSFAVCDQHGVPKFTHRRRRQMPSAHYSNILAVKTGANKSERAMIEEAIAAARRARVAESPISTDVATDSNYISDIGQADQSPVEARPDETGVSAGTAPESSCAPVLADESVAIEPIGEVPVDVGAMLAAISARLDGVAATVERMAAPAVVKPKDGVRLLRVRRYLAMRAERSGLRLANEYQRDRLDNWAARVKKEGSRRIRAAFWALTLRARLKSTRAELATARAEANAAVAGLEMLGRRADQLQQQLEQMHRPAPQLRAVA